MTAESKRSAPRDVVLLVDSEVLVRHALAEFLRDCGFSVIEAATTDEALAVARTEGVSLAAVLCAVASTGTIGGFAVARTFAAEKPGLPVLLAGSVEKAAAEAAALCEEGPELARPYDPALVLDRIRRRLAARDRNGG